MTDNVSFNSPGARRSLRRAIRRDRSLWLPQAEYVIGSIWLAVRAALRFAIWSALGVPIAFVLLVTFYPDGFVELLSRPLDADALRKVVSTLWIVSIAGTAVCYAFFPGPLSTSESPWQQEYRLRTESEPAALDIPPGVRS